MATLLGILGATDATRVADINTETVTQAVNALLARYVEERDALFGYWVEDETTKFKTLYQVGGGDEMQELGPHGRPVEDRVVGEIETAYPIKRFGSAFGYDRETFAYMTAADLNRQIDAKTIGNAKTHRRELMRALFGKDNYTWKDEVPGIMAGNLTIRRLANSDGTLYPPAEGSAVEADDNHYLVSGYADTAISATNNPLVTLAAKLRKRAGADPIVVHINSAQRGQVQQGITTFVDAPVEGITPGDNEPQAAGIAGAPGEFIGVDRDSGAYVYVWDVVPANYMVARATGQRPPLRRRVHIPAELRGFRLEAEESHDPLFKRSYRDRFGYGVGNRLGAAIIQLKASGSYDTPAIYA